MSFIEAVGRLFVYCCSPNLQVKNLLGKVTELDIQGCLLGSQLHDAVDKSLKGSFKLYWKGAELSHDCDLNALCIDQSDFLIALPVKRKKKKRIKEACGEEPTGINAAVLSHQTAGPILEESQASPLELQGLRAQDRNGNGAGPAKDAVHAEMDDPDPGTPTRPLHHRPAVSPFAQLQSPPKDDLGMFSLLPGYNSRPNPSPEKARKRQRVAPQDGGFASQRLGSTANASGQLKKLDKRSSRLSSGRTSMTSSMPSLSSQPSSCELQNADTLPSDPARSSRPASANGPLTELSEDPSVLARTGDKAVQQTKQAGSPAVQGKSGEALPQRRADRGVADEFGEEKRRRADVGNSLWAELAEELHASEQRRQQAVDPGSPKMPVVPLSMGVVLQNGDQPSAEQLASPSLSLQQKATPKGKEKQKMDRVELKARNALLAHAERNSVLREHKSKSPAKTPMQQAAEEQGSKDEANTSEDPAAEPKKALTGKGVKERVFLPGGQDLRLTAQGRLTSKEAATVGKLPLPASLARLERIFNALNTMHSFLQKQDIQASWQVMRNAVKDFPGVDDPELEDLEKMVKLCPDVVFLHDATREDGPRSIVEFNQKLQSLEHVMEKLSPSRSPLQSLDSHVKEEPNDDPLSIHSDAAEIIRQRARNSLILEITDISRHSVGMIARAMSLDVDTEVPPSLLSGPAGTSGKGGEEGEDNGDGISHDEASAEEDPLPQKVEKGRKAAIARRRGAFRRGLVRSVMLLHDAFLEERKGKLTGAGEVDALPVRDSPNTSSDPAGLIETEPASAPKPRGKGKKSQAGQAGKAADTAEGFDPLKQGRWFPEFRLADVSMENLINAAVNSATDYELAQQNGRLKHFRGDFVASTNAPRPPRMTRKTEPCRDCTQMGVLEFLEHLQDLQWYNAQIVHMEDMPARAGIYKDTVRKLSVPTVRALAARGISQLFSHQADAIDSATSGRHVVISTSTASGKSLCYNIPVIEALAENRCSTAIYIFPTKALAQDQMRALRGFLGAAFPEDTPIADVYDGDTEKEERGEIRSRAQMIITNPDMLHQSILPLHGQFATLLSNLKYIIVDEGHAYRGAFGCHTALVLRRLRRICSRVYNTFPTFVVTSATIANPKELVKSLLGVEEVTLIDQDGSPHGPQRYVLWNPPLTHFNEALKAANQGDSAGGQMSRTEGRARKGERKRKSRRAVVRAVEEGIYEDGGEPDDNANHAFAISVARMHRLRNSIQAPQDSVSEVPPKSDDLGVESEDDMLDCGLEDADDPEQLAVQNLTSRHQQSVPNCADHILQKDAADEQSNEQSGLEPRQDCSGSRSQTQPGIPRRRGKSRMLSKEAIQAAMSQRADHASQKEDASSRVDAKQALSAVAGIVLAPKERPTFQPKDIVYRTDEPGSSSPQRLVLRRKLHGERYGQKSGIKHPMGQYAHATGDTNLRMPGEEWRKQPGKGKYGTAGVTLDKRRKSPIVEISTLLVECVQHGLRTIAFCKTRKLCELVITYTREMLRQSAPHLSHAISVYRAGYNPTERREIEKALFNGDILAVAATNALELGLDVGSLDLTMHLGFQGSIASFRQQAGRAGRREQQSMSIYVAFDGPLDQYFMTFPRNLFDKPIEGAHIDPENMMLMEQHLVCASAETPLIASEDQHYFGGKVQKAIDTLTAEGFVGRHPMSTARVQAVHYIGRYDNPASQFSLRAIDPERYQIVNEVDGRVIEEIEESKAFFQVYDGAVYMFQGRTYLCKKLDLQTKTAIVRSVDVKYYTSIREHQDIFVVGGSAVYPTPEAILDQLRGDEEPTMAQCAEAEHTTRWLGYHRVRHGTGEIFDTVDLFLPDVQFPTQAAYLRVPQEAKANLAKAGLGDKWREGLHAAMHAMQNVVPLHMMCGPNDLGAECDNPYSARFRPDRLLLFDKCPGGIGLAYKVCDLFGVLMRKAVALIEACPCTSDTGCPGCVQHMGCNQYNAVLHKQAGIVVLNAVLQAQAAFRQQLSLRLAATESLNETAGGILQDIGSVLNQVRT